MGRKQTGGTTVALYKTVPKNPKSES